MTRTRNGYDDRVGDPMRRASARGARVTVLKCRTPMTMLDVSVWGAWVLTRAS
jgi:hypothetical protein